MISYDMWKRKDERWQMKDRRWQAQDNLNGSGVRNGGGDDVNDEEDNDYGP